MQLRKSLFLALILISLGLSAQDEVTDPNFTEYQDKVPGTLLFEFGFNALQGNTPDKMDVGFFKSRTCNIYYMYDFRIFGSKYISFNPGFGLGMDNYMFEKDITFQRSNSNSLSVFNANLIAQGFNTDTSGVSLSKSKLSVNYFDVPMEIRFRTKPSKKSFRIAVGGKVGFRIDSKTKIKYQLDGDNYKYKSKGGFGISDIRYGLHGRLGFGSVNLFVYYALSELFDKDLIDGNGQKLDGNISNMTIGLTIVTF